MAGTAATTGGLQLVHVVNQPQAAALQQQSNPSTTTSAGNTADATGKLQTVHVQVQQ